MSSTRRKFITQIAGAGALSAGGFMGLGQATARAGTAPGADDATRADIAPMAERPNILYVILEDIGPNLACYGEPLIHTPHLDRFAAEGVRFTNAFSAAPVCSASRSALMTGTYSIFNGGHQHRTWRWNKRPLPNPVRHLCDWFRQAGYFTCNLQPAPNAKAYKQTHGGITGPLGSGKIDLNFVITEPHNGNPFDGIDWNQRGPNQAFFAHITIVETHKGPGWKLARQQPKSELVDPDKLHLPSYYPDHPVARDEYANYLDAIHQSDGFFAQLLARLERDGLAKNTIVVVSSDHGPLFRGKQFLYDNGVRIPLLIRFPDGRDAGRIDEQLVSGVDLAPTLLGFAGIKPPPGAIQGRDLFSPETRPVDTVYIARDRMDISIDRMRGLRTHRYKYLRNYLPAVPYMQHNPYKEEEYPTWNLVKELYRQGRLSPAAALFAAPTKPIEECYDILADPDEVHNLAGNEAHQDTLRELRGRLDKWLARTDRALNYEDPVDIYSGYYHHRPPLT